MENKLALISESLYSRVPYCSGIRAIPAHQFLLYYGRDSDQCQRVDLSRPSTTQMQALVKACEPATFGRDQEDVLDETYRKAGKLDTPAFATLFSAENAGLVDIIRANLLQGDIEKRDIRLEMYKLNVYGKDSFFKAHKDTPRGEDMFGSLVIVFPTPHEGGALVIRQDAKEWTVDFTEAFAEASEPSIGYIAFYSDVEHEVALVKSGYRVTLTYNLYFTGDERQDFPPPVPYVAEEELKALLVDLLSDEGVLPDGGYIGFGLQYQYPVSTGTKLRKLRKCLKGNDALLGRVCDALNFEWFIRVLYRGAGLSRWRKAHVLTDRIVDLSQYGQVEDVLDELGGETVKIVNEKKDDKKKLWSYDPETDADLLEITEMRSVGESVGSTFIAYGNEPTLEHLYGDVCLVARVNEPSRRFPSSG